MTKTSRSLYLLILILSLSCGLYIVIKDLNSSITFFYTPTEIGQSPSLPKDDVRVGGIVKPGSIHKKSATALSFIITDCVEEINITYQGRISPLFREEQGIVASGKLINKKSLIAKTLLTKHDESYRPKTLNSSKEQDFCNFQKMKK
jgi:cytochrome c-type biogenesis protein CcmE